jgi:hypothetical protein
MSAWALSSTTRMETLRRTASGNRYACLHDVGDGFYGAFFRSSVTIGRGCRREIGSTSLDEEGDRSVARVNDDYLILCH